jgi:hypothetical protein
MRISPEERSWPRPFASGGFEILASRLADHGEVTLWSTGGQAPGPGELFTIEHDDAIHDLSVVDVKGHNPGWSALCRRVDIAWS